MLTAEYIEGISVDKCVNEPQAVRDYIAGKFIELCLKEIFVWRFMQVLIYVISLLTNQALRLIQIGRISSLDLAQMESRD